jgi:hypothetical protein
MSITAMGKRIRRGWDRNAIAAVLCGGLFVAPLLIHALAL